MFLPGFEGFPSGFCHYCWFGSQAPLAFGEPQGSELRLLLFPILCLKDSCDCRRMSALAVFARRRMPNILDEQSGG